MKCYENVYYNLSLLLSKKLSKNHKIKKIIFDTFGTPFFQLSELKNTVCNKSYAL